MKSNAAKKLRLPAPETRLVLVPPPAQALLPAPERIAAIDFARGLAVVAMIGFHLVFDINHYARSLGLPNWFWWAVPSLIGGTFLTLLGVSARVRWEREGSLAIARIRAHALRIGGAALLVNIATLVVTPATPIYFGILHAASTALFALSFVVGRPRIAAHAGAAMAVLGAALATVTVSFPHLLWLGLKPAANAGWDYYPILPWMGVAWLGAALACRWKIAAEPSRRGFNGRAFKPLLWLGRHSLLVYIVHQPLLLACFWLAGFLTI